MFYFTPPIFNMCSTC